MVLPMDKTTKADLTRLQRDALRSLGYAGGRSEARKLTKTLSAQRATYLLTSLAALGLVERYVEAEWRECGKDGEQKLVDRPAWKLTTAGYAVVVELF